MEREGEWNSVECVTSEDLSLTLLSVYIFSLPFVFVISQSTPYHTSRSLASAPNEKDIISHLTVIRSLHSSHLGAGVIITAVVNSDLICFLP